MKKLLAISFAFFIVLSGMHLSIAAHICGGEVAAVKWSFFGKKATCGMEKNQQTCLAHHKIKSNCCHNTIAFYSVDNNYSPSSIQINEITKILLQVFLIPLSFSLNAVTTSTSLSKIVSPPGNLPANAVSLPDICVFRI
jgi:hypothetical protein